MPTGGVVQLTNTVYRDSDDKIRENYLNLFEGNIKVPKIQ